MIDPEDGEAIGARMLELRQMLLDGAGTQEVRTGVALQLLALCVFDIGVMYNQVHGFQPRPGEPL